MDTNTLEWFGATTYRLRCKGLTIFLDTWLDRPSGMPQYLSTDEVHEADYIFISHAHFDHLPGADRIAKATGAIVVANSEAINLLRGAGVPEDQLIPVSGGERIPLFPKIVRQKASRGEVGVTPGPPGSPIVPDFTLAAAFVNVWPALHCLMPGKSHLEIPDFMDTGAVYTGPAGQYGCGLDVTFGMKYGLLRMGDHIARDRMDQGTRAFVDYIKDRGRNLHSHCDGGQLMYNFLIGNKTLLWMAHLGGYEGILKGLQPKPDLVIMAIAGRANLNGLPFDGCAAEFARDALKWLGEPKNVIWCLHDESIIKPWRVEVGPATTLVERDTSCRVIDLQPARPFSF